MLVVLVHLSEPTLIVWGTESEFKTSSSGTPELWGGAEGEAEERGGEGALLGGKGAYNNIEGKIIRI